MPIRKSRQALSSFLAWSIVAQHAWSAGTRAWAGVECGAGFFLSHKGKWSRDQPSWSHLPPHMSNRESSLIPISGQEGIDLCRDLCTKVIDCIGFSMNVKQTDLKRDDCLLYKAFQSNGVTPYGPFEADY